jgi:uncharacterized phage-associated protein
VRLPLFFALQSADAATTVVAIRHFGGTEINPVVASVMAATDPLTALVLVKLLAFAFGAFAVWRQRLGFFTKANVIFAFVVAWNLGQIAKAI